MEIGQRMDGRSDHSGCAPDFLRNLQAAPRGGASEQDEPARMDTALTHDHLFWITSRAAGTAALLFSSVAVGFGLSMALKLFRGKGPDLRVAHEALSLATIVAIVIHAVSLLGDKFLHPSVADIAIPFASSYKEPWMSIGIVAGWTMIVLGLSYYFRRRIGSQRWRRLHRFTSVAWIAGIAHSLGEGTDAGLTWFVVCLGVTAIPAATLLAYRYLPRPRPVRAVAS
jgi:sulfoxide reductase heme-binding subunit YedZ